MTWLLFVAVVCEVDICKTAVSHLYIAGYFFIHVIWYVRGVVWLLLPLLHTCCTILFLVLKTIRPSVRRNEGRIWVRLPLSFSFFVEACYVVCRLLSKKRDLKEEDRRKDRLHSRNSRHHHPNQRQHPIRHHHHQCNNSLFPSWSTTTTRTMRRVPVKNQRMPLANESRRESSHQNRRERNRRPAVASRPEQQHQGRSHPATRRIRRSGVQQPRRKSQRWARRKVVSRQQQSHDWLDSVCDRWRLYNYRCDIASCSTIEKVETGIIILWRYEEYAHEIVDNLEQSRKFVRIKQSPIASSWWAHDDVLWLGIGLVDVDHIYIILPVAGLAYIHTSSIVVDSMDGGEFLSLYWSR